MDSHLLQSIKSGFLNETGLDLMVSTHRAHTICKNEELGKKRKNVVVILNKKKGIRNEKA